MIRSLLSYPCRRFAWRLILFLGLRLLRQLEGGECGQMGCAQHSLRARCQISKGRRNPRGVGLRVAHQGVPWTMVPRQLCRLHRLGERALSALAALVRLDPCTQRATL